MLVVYFIHHSIHKKHLPILCCLQALIHGRIYKDGLLLLHQFNRAVTSHSGKQKILLIYQPLKKR